jgi:GMP synthase (glutamine-hydrolysing)
LSASSGVLIVDFSADPGRRDWGAAIAAALSDDVSVATLRGTAGAAWANAAIESGRPVILSGSDVTVPRDEAWFDGQCAEIRAALAAGVPLFGICFGHQLIAQALGGAAAVRRAARGEFGVTAITPLPPLAGDPVLGRVLPPQAPATVYNLHADEVSETAAASLGLAILAASADCAVQAFRLPGRPVWGVQFHPEMTGAVVAAVAATAAAEFGNARADTADLAAIAGDDRHRRPEILAAFLASGRG